MQNYAHTLLVLRGKKYALVVLGLLSTITLIWIITIIFSTQTNSSVDKNVLKATTSLKPYFNTQALQVIGQKTNLSDEELDNFKIRIFETDSKTKEKTIQIIENN